MRRGRAPIVRIVAGLAVALSLVGLAAPGHRLWAQKPEAVTFPELPSGRYLTSDVEYFAAEPAADPLPPAKPVAAPSPPKAAALADPEGAAKAFVDRSQKEADEAIKALSEEAETLRARLQKVEAGLARWEAIKESLGAHAGADHPAWRPRDVPPTILEPISPVESKPRSRRPRRDATPPIDDAEPPTVPAPNASAPEPPRAKVEPPALPPAPESTPKGVVLRPEAPTPTRSVK